MENNVQNLNRAKQLVNELIPIVEQAEGQFKSARNWSLLDVFGGGMITDLIKHMKLNRASGLMDEVNFRMQELQRVLGNISVPVDYRMEMGGISTFGDFVFDGVIFDSYMAMKIFSSLEEVKKLKNKLYVLKERLESL